MATSPVRLAELRAGTGLRMPHCCILGLAELHGAAVATFDERLREVAASRGLSVRPLD